MTTSHDNPNNEDDDGTPPAGGEVGPGPQPPSATPANVEQHRVPGPQADERLPRQPRGEINPRNVLVATLATAAVALVVIVIVHNSGGSKQPTVPGHTPPNNGGQTGSAETPTTPTTPTTSTQPKYPTKPRYTAELTFIAAEGERIGKEHVESASNEDFFTETQETHHYFHVEGPNEGSGRVASWKGQGKPTLPGCKHTLETSGGREVSFEQVGEWICAETYQGVIGLLRYSGSGTMEGSYNFSAKVYPPLG